MVDRSARDVAAAALQEFYDGKISTAELDARYPTWSGDLALNAIYLRFSDYIDDFSEFRFDLVKHQDDVELLGRCIEFLKTDLEYAWPDLRGRIRAFLLRFFDRTPEQASARDPNAWPFEHLPSQD